MLRKLLLSPYYLTLKIRHNLYDKGIRKVHTCDVPTICVGNIAVGGTGKTPHTEMIVRTLIESEDWKGNIAVLSRGHKRKSTGFQQVIEGGTVKMFGDEPLQIKNKFPEITVAVDRTREEGCHFLTNPEALLTDKKARKCIDKNIPKADVIILDDAYQYRGLKAMVDICLVDFTRPANKDILIPFGNLRDLPERLYKADIIIVTKCPNYMEDNEKEEWVKNLGITGYTTSNMTGRNAEGKEITILFTTINYCSPKRIYEEGNTRFAYSKKAILFTGIAKDLPLRRYLSDSYKLVNCFKFGDHHTYRRHDFNKILSAAKACPIAVVATTEEDAQRVKDYKKVPEYLKERLFQVPIEVSFLSWDEKVLFEKKLIGALAESRSES